MFRDGVVGNISACHADARGSIPRRGVSIKISIIITWLNLNNIYKTLWPSG